MITISGMKASIIFSAGLQILGNDHQIRRELTPPPQIEVPKTKPDQRTKDYANS